MVTWIRSVTSTEGVTEGKTPYLLSEHLLMILNEKPEAGEDSWSDRGKASRIESVTEQSRELISRGK